MLKLTAKPREALGKKAKHVRKNGEVPAVLYGYGVQSTPLSVDARAFTKAWKEAGESSLVELHVDGAEARNVLIHDVSVDPLHETLLHVDLYAVRMDRALEADVRIEFVGESEAVKAFGGILVRVVHEMRVRALPKDLPHELIADISALKTLEDQITIRDIALPSGVEILAEEDQVVALVERPRTEEEIAALDTEQPASLEDIEIAGKKEKEEGAEGEGEDTEKSEKKGE